MSTNAAAQAVRLRSRYWHSAQRRTAQISRLVIRVGKEGSYVPKKLVTYCSKGPVSGTKHYVGKCLECSYACQTGPTNFIITLHGIETELCRNTICDLDRHLLYPDRAARGVASAERVCPGRPRDRGAIGQGGGSRIVVGLPMNNAGA